MLFAPTYPSTHLDLAEKYASWMELPTSIANMETVDPLDTPFSIAFLRVREIFASDASSSRTALAKVYATLDPSLDAALVYVVEGAPEGVQLYLGVIAAGRSHLLESRKLLASALRGHLPGLSLQEDIQEDEARRLIQSVLAAPERGLLLGVPTAHEDDHGEDDDFQGFERLARALLMGLDGRSGDRWRLAVVSRPLPPQRVRQLLDDALALATDVAARASAQLQYAASHSHQSGLTVGTNRSEGTTENTSTQRGKTESGSRTTTTSSSISETEAGSSCSFSKQTGTSRAEGTSVSTQESMTKTSGTSTTRGDNLSHSASSTVGNNLSVSSQITDKKLDLLREHLEESLIPRLRHGQATGLFHTRVVLAADTPSAFRRLANTVRAIFQGTEAALSPLTVLHLPPDTPLSLLPVERQGLLSWQALAHSRLPEADLGTLLTAQELAILAGLPRQEIPGIARRPTVPFALSLPPVPDATAVPLGCIVDQGRRLADLPLRLAREDFAKHIFVTGVTGSGKTTTCLALLMATGVPFLVIEPAKTEYRALFAHAPDLVHFRPLADRTHSFRINPLALTRPGQLLMSHVEFLSAVLTAVFPMEASMPYLVKQAMTRAYERRGWDTTYGQWLGQGDPFEPATAAWPTLSEMIRELDGVIKAQKMGKEFEEKYRGSLVSRLTDLTRGPLGPILDVRQSIDWDALLDQRVVLELEEVKSPQAKALLMALTLGALAEAVKARHARDRRFQHLTLVEEAHRLLAQPAPGADDSRALAVSAFADLLAEVRKYGEGLIVVDQIPAKLIPDVLKNTHTKIVHRLFAADDRRAMGDAMMMSEEQRDFLPKLKTGEAVVYCGGWHMPALAAIQALDGSGTEPSDAELDARAARQLWDQRHRFTPALCRLGILTTDPSQAPRYAAFLEDARKALTAWIQLMGPGPTDHAGAAARHLTGLWTRWSPELQNLTPLPEMHCRFPLAAALLAVACDSNPLPRTEATDAAPLGITLESEIWGQAMDVLAAHLAAGTPASQMRSTQLSCPDGLDADQWRMAVASYAEIVSCLHHYERF